ncbi:LysR family transcriptional regulator [Yoonia sp. R2331]|uniref:LysR family transcriptional regulator n=1 Tax=Yoonia sp. R2331 TaxID=3237238 RepID=UPI0034E52D3D
MNITLKQLEAFVWVADLRSFNKAAERLATTQPNISGRIAKLEGLLGGRLLDRDTMQVTPLGARMLKRARDVLAAMDALVVESGEAGLYDGVLRLGVTEMVAETWLRAFLVRLADAFPKMDVELTVDFSAALEKRLAERAIDLALQNAPFQRAMSGEVALGTYPMVWVAAPGVTEVAGQPVLTHGRDTILFQQIAAHFAAQGGAAVRLVPSSNLATGLLMAMDGRGVTVVPEAMARGALAAGKLVQIDYGWAPEPLRFFARYDAERTQAAVAQSAAIALDTANHFS